MKKLFLFLFIPALLLMSCKKNDDTSLEEHVVGKWILYEKTDTGNTDPLAGFEFKSDGTLYIYAEGDFNSALRDTWHWTTDGNKGILITLQGAPVIQGGPIMFPNAQQGDDPIMIPVNIWNQGDPIMAINIYNTEYKLVKQ